MAVIAPILAGGPFPEQSTTWAARHSTLLTNAAAGAGPTVPGYDWYPPSVMAAEPGAPAFSSAGVWPLKPPPAPPPFSDLGPGGAYPEERQMRLGYQMQQDLVQTVAPKKARD
jgi:hypothetical protein